MSIRKILHAINYTRECFLCSWKKKDRFTFVRIYTSKNIKTTNYSVFYVSARTLPRHTQSYCNGFENLTSTTRIVFDWKAAINLPDWPLSLFFFYGNLMRLKRNLEDCKRGRLFGAVQRISYGIKSDRFPNTPTVNYNQVCRSQTYRWSVPIHRYIGTADFTNRVIKSRYV